MAHALRLLLVWLIMLTLPLQGVSASVMSLRLGSETGHSTTQHSNMVGTDCHDSMPADALESKLPDPASHGSHAPIKAKVCSSCCTGALSGATEIPQLSGPLGRNQYLSAYFPAPKGHIPDGLERPPRRIS